MLFSKTETKTKTKTKTKTLSKTETKTKSETKTAISVGEFLDTGAGGGSTFVCSNDKTIKLYFHART